MSGRLTQYRESMAGLNATAPREALSRQFYVATPGKSVADRLAGRAELAATSSQVIAGGIGAGKTTQLLVAQSRINRLSDTRALYRDVSEDQDLVLLKPGALLAATALALVDHARELDLDVVERGAGLLVPPEKPLSEQSRVLLRLLEELTAVVRLRTPHLIILLDSLDRVSDLAAFASVVEQDVPALKKLGLGIAMVAPLRTLFGSSRVILDRFDELHDVSPVDVTSSNEGRGFLKQVLHRRVPETLLSADLCDVLARLSGGVLRDLIALARSAGEHAYMDDADAVSMAHVQSAADTFGRKLLFGATSKDISLLRGVETSQQFVPTSDEDLALLMTRRILEYQNGRTRYRVHPTIAPLIAHARPS